MSSCRFFEFIESFNCFASLTSVLHNKTKKKLAITFDDGLEDIYEIAYPALCEKGIPFTMFIAPGLLNTEGYISTSQLVEMSKEPLVSVGSHCLSHVPIKGLSEHEQNRELFESKSILEDILGKQVDYLAYPYGQIDRQGLKLLKDTKEYDYGFIASGGPIGRIPKNRYKIPRLRIDDKRFNETITLLKRVYK